MGPAVKVLEEIPEWVKLVEKANNGFMPLLYQPTKFRVRLSRKLFWAEREAFDSFLLKKLPTVVEWSYHEPTGNRDPHLTVEVEQDSRSAFPVVQKLLGEEFTNVYVKSVKTWTEGYGF